jgi:hypothetical protein
MRSENLALNLSMKALGITLISRRWGEIFHARAGSDCLLSTYNCEYSQQKYIRKGVETYLSTCPSVDLNGSCRG